MYAIYYEERRLSIAVGVLSPLRQLLWRYETVMNMCWILVMPVTKIDLVLSYWAYLLPNSQAAGNSKHSEDLWGKSICRASSWELSTLFLTKFVVTVN